MNVSIKQDITRALLAVTVLLGGGLYVHGDRTEPFQSKGIEKLARITSKGGSCSGFKFDTGVVLTAAHCLTSDKETEYIVDTYGDKNLNYDKMKVVYVNDKYDFAILGTEKSKLDHVPLHRFSIEHKEGDLYNILAVDGMNPVTRFKERKFLVEGMQYALYTARIMGHAEIKGGSSGGSVIDDDGFIKGIISIGNNVGDVGLTDSRDIVREIKKQLKRK